MLASRRIQGSANRAVVDAVRGIAGNVKNGDILRPAPILYLIACRVQPICSNAGQTFLPGSRGIRGVEIVDEMVRNRAAGGADVADKTEIAGPADEIKQPENGSGYRHFSAADIKKICLADSKYSQRDSRNPGKKWNDDKNPAGKTCDSWNTPSSRRRIAPGRTWRNVERVCRQFSHINESALNCPVESFTNWMTKLC